MKERQVSAVIAKLAQHVAEYGLPFEERVRAEQKDQPEFRFLSHQKARPDKAASLTDRVQSAARTG